MPIRTPAFSQLIRFAMIAIPLSLDRVHPFARLLPESAAWLPLVPDYPALAWLPGYSNINQGGYLLPLVSVFHQSDQMD